MNVREATPEDAAAIRDVAGESLRTSYNALDDDVIETALEKWYGEEAMSEKFDDENVLFLVVEEEGGTAAGFSQSYIQEDDGQIQWLHVAPDERGAGLGTTLLDVTRDTLAGRGVERITGAVLAANEEGNEFYREHGFTMVDQRTIEVGEEFHAENVYADVVVEDGELESVETPDGTLYVDRDDPTRGKLAPFYPAYRSQEGSERYGWFCGNCNTVDNAVDTMDRIVCNECGNVHKADRWDAAYL